MRAAGAEGKTLKNVAVDTRTMTILGSLYGNYCTNITAQVVEGGTPMAEMTPVEAAPVVVGRKLSTGLVVKGNEGGIEYSLLDFVQDPNRPVDKTTWFNFDRVVFPTGSAEIDMEASKEQLSNIHEILKAYPNVKLKVGGYTDNTGSAATNKKLSGQRASAVAAALKNLGTDGARLDPEGYGPEHPLCPANDTPDCRAQNRRLAVRVTAK
ncbi:MAG: OmpA family protein [Deltaproteobacteria bacterium]|nr:OmpA family protein [Deltaproteobacteria bacterium]